MNRFVHVWHLQECQDKEGELLSFQASVSQNLIQQAETGEWNTNNNSEGSFNHITGRAEHFRYFLSFSIIKNYYLHFLSSYFYWEFYVIFSRFFSVLFSRVFSLILAVFFQSYSRGFLGYAEGEMCHRLVMDTFSSADKQAIAISVPLLVKQRRILRNILVNHGGLEVH